MDWINTFLAHYKAITPILTAIKHVGGNAYLVGGCVRDLVLQEPLKDLDIEVHGLTADQLEGVLAAFGSVMLIGKKFGVFRLAHHDIDWSLPRTDSAGRKPTVTLDPHIGIEKACKRRDLTMNAMALDLHHALLSNQENAPTTQELIDCIIDPYGGRSAIEKKQLCAVDSAIFLEDPLRFFRVMHFIGRFNMQPDQSLNKLCSTMQLWDTTTNTPLAKERIFEEIKKLLLKSARPSLGFRWLAEIKRLSEIFPELGATVGLHQRKDFHPEKDVFEHSMQSLDAAARFIYTDQQEQVIMLLAALCHDLGKPMTTDASGRAHGHDLAGVPVTESFLKRITSDQKLIKTCGKLVRYHLAPFAFLDQEAQLKAYKRLAAKLSPETSLQQLAQLALADHQGRNGQSSLPLTIGDDVIAKFIAKATEAGVINQPEAPILQGRHIVDLVGSGPRLGRLLAQAYTMQIEDGITDLELLKKRILG
jgi:tRNA nucleotidyltransferase (CCA-adding enzyme)